METLDDISSSFEPSEKALQSILTSVQSNSIPTGRESATRRRSSVTEAFIKLRAMHCIPPLAKDKDPNSVAESKSPPPMFVILFYNLIIFVNFLVRQSRR